MIVVVPLATPPPSGDVDGDLDCNFTIPDPKEPAVMLNVSPAAYPVPKAAGVIVTVAICALPVTPIGAPVVTVAVAFIPFPLPFIGTNLLSFGSKS